MFELWDAFVSTFAAFFATGCGNEHCEWLTNRADGALKRITDAAQKDVSSLYDPVIQAFEDNPWQDLLGDVYMRLNIGNKKTGQFFTPYHLAEAMARLNLDEQMVKDAIEQHGYITVNEPAAGGGANVIGCAHVLRDWGFNYQTQTWFVCQELSELTALTCYVQMSILGMAGIVQVGDTLKMDFRHSLYTPMCVMDERWAWRSLAKVMMRI
jgi:type I restriction-modification system DNA methylase subunit